MNAIEYYYELIKISNSQYPNQKYLLKFNFSKSILGNETLKIEFNNYTLYDELEVHLGTKYVEIIMQPYYKGYKFIVKI